MKILMEIGILCEYIKNNGKSNFIVGNFGIGGMGQKGPWFKRIYFGKSISGNPSLSVEQ